jgi:hypothetical protein
VPGLAVSCPSRVLIVSPDVGTAWLRPGVRSAA